MNRTIKEVLMERDGMSSEDALDLIQAAADEAVERLESGDMPFDICEEYFGLEPDYLDDLINNYL